MKNFFILLFGILLLSSCNKQEEKKTVAKKDVPAKTESKQFEMYEMSEMAALMEQMYVDNQRLKERIKNGDTIGKFPSHFLEIHKSAMTDESENDAFFKKQAEVFINSQKLIYEDPKNAKEHFNAGVSACLACHQVKCAGPIPRIKKLFIE
ncbi:hypothetical protein [uncultured Flavobacterium sp.]|uniref:hypothetical protein n=1 Tax=uncultured Flavobacterium sp. TaxID=165435 RepID=UPI0025E5D252|nr:hypothetical protein [uncultured Flavobacterium sp.]